MNLFESLQLLEENKSYYYYKVEGSDNYIIAKSTVDLNLFNDRSYGYMLNILLQYSDISKYDTYFIGKLKSITETTEEEYDKYFEFRYLNGFEDEDEEKIYVLYFLSQNDNPCYLANKGVVFDINEAKYVNKEDAIKIYKNRTKYSPNKEYEIYNTKTFKEVTNKLIKEVK